MQISTNIILAGKMLIPSGSTLIRAWVDGAGIRVVVGPNGGTWEDRVEVPTEGRARVELETFLGQLTP